MPKPPPPSPSRYGIAVASVLLAVAARWALHPLLGQRQPFVTFYIALIVSAWFGGLGPSLVALALGALSTLAFFMPWSGSPSANTAADLLGTALYVVVGSVLVAYSQAHRTALSRLERAEASERRQRRRVETTLASIGDAVMTTDAGGRVTFMNAVAEALTGWTQHEPRAAPGRGLPHRQRGDPHEAENPADRALREGAVVGLANHTVLIARDGTERPIDDSAAPIRDDDGAVTGAVLVFRDVAGRRDAERDAGPERAGARRLLRECHGRPALGRAGRDHPAGQPGRTGHARLQPGGVRRSPHRRLPRRRGRDLRHPPAVAGRGEAARLPGPAAVQGRVDQGRADRLQRACGRTASSSTPAASPGTSPSGSGPRRRCGTARSGSARWPSRSRNWRGWPGRTGTSTGTTGGGTSTPARPPSEMEGWGWQSGPRPRRCCPSVLERWKASIASGEPFDMVVPAPGGRRQLPPVPHAGRCRCGARTGEVAHWFGTNTDIADRLEVERGVAGGQGGGRGGQPGEDPVPRRPLATSCGRR